MYLSNFLRGVKRRLAVLRAFSKGEYPAQRGENPSSVRCPALQAVPPSIFPKCGNKRDYPELSGITGIS
jgi:hypothetical protein